MKRVTFGQPSRSIVRRKRFSTAMHQLVAAGLLLLCVAGSYWAYEREPEPVGARAKAQDPGVKFYLFRALGFGCVFSLAYLCGAIAAGRRRRQNDLAQAVQDDIDAAHRRYRAALRNLEEDPSNVARRKRALEAGREYAEVTRQYAGHGGIAIFDEIALSNDLNARTGRGVT